MTGHEESELEPAFREFREALAPLEASGKMRGVLLQYHPRVKKSPEALAELTRRSGAARPARAADRVPAPLLGGRGRARRHAALPRARGARLRLARLAADPRDERRAHDRGRHAPGGVRSLPRPELAHLEHPQREELRRSLRPHVHGGGAGGMGRAARPARRRGRGGLRAHEQQPRRLCAAERADSSAASSTRRGSRRAAAWSRPTTRSWIWACERARGRPRRGCARRGRSATSSSSAATAWRPG